MNKSSYSTDNGKYQDKLNILQKLVPVTGIAGLPHIELIRNVANLYYDLYNNGGGNWNDYFAIQLTNLKQVPNTDLLISEIANKLNYCWNASCWCADGYDSNTGEECTECNGYGHLSPLRADFSDDFNYLAEQYEQLADLVIEYAWQKHQEIIITI